LKGLRGFLATLLSSGHNNGGRSYLPRRLRGVILNVVGFKRIAVRKEQR
jgi:hypothetical protein